MFTRNETQDTMPAKSGTTPESQDQPATKPEWPLGIRISQQEKLKCFLPEDLKVILTQEAFEQLFGYAYATHSEISCLGMVRREGSCFIIERFHLIKQEGGAAHTEMDPSAIAELMEAFLSQGKTDEAKSLKCWAHSHPGMSVFWSKTDDTTCALLASDYLVSVVVSDHFAIRCRIDTRSPLPFTVDNVPVVCEFVPNPTHLADYAKEVADKVQDAPRLPSAQPDRQPSSLGLVEDDLWSDYFHQAHELYDDEETLELKPVREDFDPFE